MLIHGPNLNLGDDKLDFSLSMKGRASYRYLGITIDDKLNWKEHIQHLCSKLAMVCGVISKIRHYLDRKSLLLIYHALFESRLRYAILGWGTASENDLSKVRILQNRVVRFITFASFRSPAAPYNSTLKILPLYQQLFVQKAIFMHNLHYKNLPFALSVYCQQPEHRYPTRYMTSHNYVLPRATTNRGQKSIKFAGPKVWAEIPKHLKEVAFRKPFSRKLKEHILSEIFVDLPKKVYLKTDNIGQYKELQEIFQANDSQDEFFGFDCSDSNELDIIFLNDRESTSDKFSSVNDPTEDTNLDAIFQSDSDNSDNEFFGFYSEECVNSGLESLFLSDDSDGEFLGF